MRTNRFTAQLIHGPHSALPLRADWQWAVERPQSRWGGAEHFALDGHATREATNAPSKADSARVWWGALEPFHIDWESRMEGVALTNVVVDRLAVTGQWRAPEVLIDKFHGGPVGVEAVATIHGGLSGFVGSHWPPA